MFSKGQPILNYQLILWPSMRTVDYWVSTEIQHQARSHQRAIRLNDVTRGIGIAILNGVVDDHVDERQTS